MLADQPRMLLTPLQARPQTPRLAPVPQAQAGSGHPRPAQFGRPGAAGRGAAAAGATGGCCIQCQRPILSPPSRVTVAASESVGCDRHGDTDVTKSA